MFLQFAAEIQFPSEEELHDLQNEILDQFGVPDGYVYEYDGNLPEELGYWAYQFDDEGYQDFKTLSSDIVAYKEKISSIRHNAQTTKIHMITKALIFAAFVLAETYTKVRIVSKLPDVNATVLEPRYQSIVENSISNSLRTTDGRAKLFKMAFHEEGLKLIQIPNVELRNALAHDIESPQIKNGSITYASDKMEKGKTILISEVFDSLADYPEALQGNQSERRRK